MADDADRMRLAQDLQGGAKDFQQAPWWYRNAHMFSPGGLMQEGLFQAGLGQTGQGYDMLKRMGGAVDTLGAVFGSLPLAGRAVLGKAGMAGGDASMADSMMRYMPEDVLQASPPSSVFGRVQAPIGPGPNIWGASGTRYGTIDPGNLPRGMNPLRPGNLNVDDPYTNAALAQQLRKGFEVVK